MVQAFDFETGLPRKYVRMDSWPLMERLSRPFWDHLGRAALESFVPTKTTEGFLVMFDRLVTRLPAEDCMIRCSGAGKQLLHLEIACKQRMQIANSHLSQEAVFTQMWLVC